ncbi:hypothetical protein HG530_004551 [Fusarium avenaceum]|nr:hypothetical protein HG530_004551 [Fusarium avenaceum]
MAKVQCPKLILLNQVGQPGLGKTNSDTELRDHIPFQLSRGDTDISEALGVALGRVRTCRGPERRGQTVNRAGESKNSVSVNITGKPQYCVAVDASVFKVDSSTSILTNNDLKLVVPSVGTCADLNTLLDFAGTAKHVLAEGGSICRLCVVQTKDEKSSVYNTERIRIVGAWLAGQDISEA